MLTAITSVLSVIAITYLVVNGALFINTVNLSNDSIKES